MAGDAQTTRAASTTAQGARAGGPASRTRSQASADSDAGGKSADAPADDRKTRRRGQPPRRGPGPAKSKLLCWGAVAFLLSPVWVSVLLAWSFISWATSYAAAVLGPVFTATTSLVWVWQATLTDTAGPQWTDYAWSTSLADVIVIAAVAAALLVAVDLAFPTHELPARGAGLVVGVATTVALVLKADARDALSAATGLPVANLLLAWTGIWVWVVVLRATRVWRPVTPQRLDRAEQAVLLATMSSPYVRRQVGGLGTVEVLPTLLDDGAKVLFHTPRGQAAVDASPQPRDGLLASATPVVATKYAAPNGAGAVQPGFGKHESTIVLIHGFGAGNTFWSVNIDDLAKQYNVYAVDWRGCGASTRERFTAKEAMEAEDWFVQGLVRWREAHPHKAHTLDKFIIVAHSMGAMIAANYTMKYPERVQQLILASPCGVPDPPEQTKSLPTLWRVVRALWSRGLTPHGIARWLGPLGPWFIRSVVERRTSWMDERSAINDGTLNRTDVATYIYQSWAAPASGEYAMNTMLLPGAHAFFPLKRRFIQADGTVHPTLRDIPIGFIYGGKRDWMDQCNGEELVANLQAAGKPDVALRSVSRGGHQLFLNNPTEFNRFVLELIPTLAQLRARAGAST